MWISHYHRKHGVARENGCYNVHDHMSDEQGKWVFANEDSVKDTIHIKLLK